MENNAQNPHGDTQFKPNTTVAIVVCCQDKYLLVEETELGNQVFNQPAGHLEEKESLISAAKRELLEETGLALTPDYCSGIYYFHRPELNLYFLRFCFVIELDELPVCQPQDKEIIACHWFSYEELIEKKNSLRSPMVLTCIKDYLNGQRIELSAIQSNL